MMSRCYKPEWRDYAEYGGRGIYVCDRWRDVRHFIADNQTDYRPSLSLDRRDGNGPYAPDNCRWVTARDQANNKRTNRRLTFQGRTQTLQQWSRETGIHYRTINSRLDVLGWSVEAALTQPARPIGPRRLKHWKAALNRATTKAEVSDIVDDMLAAIARHEGRS